MEPKQNRSIGLIIKRFFAVFIIFSTASGIVAQIETGTFTNETFGRLLEEFEESLEEMESEDIQTNYQPESVNKRNPVRDKQSILSRIFQGKTDRY